MVGQSKDKPVAPYGSWPTPITSDLIVQAGASVSEVALDGDAVWWAERRPKEGGRTQLVRWRAGTGPVDVLPEEYDVRTAVHEYGGAGWWVTDGQLWFVNGADQGLYSCEVGEDGHAQAQKVQRVQAVRRPYVARGDRWADGTLGAGPSDGWMVVVRERHVPGGGPAEVLNELLALRQGVTEDEGATEIVYGPDFVSNPRFSPDGTQVAWVQWHHPDMPWDGTELCVADWGGRKEPWVGSDESEDREVHWELMAPALTGRETVAGRPDGATGDGESVAQPEWAPDGSLWFISDRSGWWNLYRYQGGPGRQGTVQPMVEVDADIGMPQWVFGQSRYAFLSGGRLVFAFQRGGFDHLAVRSADGQVTTLDLPYTEYASLKASGDQVVCVAGSPAQEPTVIRLQIDVVSGSPGVVKHEVLRPARELGLGKGWLSTPEAITFPTSEGHEAHALFYSPANPDVAAPKDEKPPLLVLIHGGPTSAARPIFKLATQYWTSRGFAVVDVNYRGSTGYGRDYRNRLRGQWGVADLDDCESAAQWLAEQGRVDPQRLCIRGGSAGGYTALAALATRNTFAAGASHYGIADLSALAEETHKFESRYMDTLVGPYPAQRAIYETRSPINHLDGFNRPLAVFQGLDDKVVPPNQAEMIVEALRSRGVPVAYTPFEGEEHGFRKAENIQRALDGELSFYSQVFGFELPAEEGIEPVPL